MLIILTQGCHSQKPTRQSPTDIQMHNQRDSQSQSQSQLIIHSAVGNTQPIIFNVEVMRSSEEHAKGMMFRESIKDNEGMLFIMKRNSVHSFWMKNTLIPLDMIFITEDFKIAGIVHEAQPLSLAPRSVDKNSKYVLEIKGGLSKKLNINTGDTITLP